jgi:hypothetical protein
MLLGGVMSTCVKKPVTLQKDDFGKCTILSILLQLKAKSAKSRKAYSSSSVTSNMRQRFHFVEAFRACIGAAIRVPLNSAIL